MAARYSKKNRLDDFNYFLKNYDKIYKQYGHTFVVIKNKNVLGAYNNVAEALENTTEPIGSYILQECNGKESGYTSYISSFNLFKVQDMEVFTKKFKNVEDRILIDTTVSFLKNKMKSNQIH